MKHISCFFSFMLCVLMFYPLSLYGQSGNITNTLGSGGVFTVKGVSTTLLSLSQSSNTSVGSAALSWLTTGDYNSAFGCNSLERNTTGSSNSAFGNYSLLNNTEGGCNAAFGSLALVQNQTGWQNAAFGYLSLRKNVTGFNNSAFGYAALHENTASNNSAFGSNALQNHTTGEYNSAFGTASGTSLVSGSNNTFMGYFAQPSSSTVSNEITLGNSNVTTLRCAVTTITALSDKRDKSNIRDLPLGLDFLMNVKPRLFNWDKRDWYENKKSNGTKIQKTPTAGFIAQELDEAQIKANAEWLNLVLKSNPERLEATPGNLLPIIVKAIQELKDQKDKEIAELKKEIERLKKNKDMGITVTGYSE